MDIGKLEKYFFPTLTTELNVVEGTTISPLELLSESERHHMHSITQLELEQGVLSIQTSPSKFYKQMSIVASFAMIILVISSTPPVLYPLFALVIGGFLYSRTWYTAHSHRKSVKKVKARL